MNTSESNIKGDDDYAPRANVQGKPHYSLADLLAQYDPRKHHRGEIDWGAEVGRERVG